MKYKIYIFMMIVFFSFSVSAQGEATLNNIKVNGTECTCVGYECVVDIAGSSAKITYDLVDKDAKVDRLSGFSVDLLSEITSIKLTVTNSVNEEKIENIYNITINKKAPENDLSLKSLKVNGSTIKIAEDIVVYSYNCEYDTKVIKLEVVPNASNVTVIKEDEYEFPLEDGSISIDFALKPASGEQLDYRVVVTRDIKPTLKSLKVNDKVIELSDSKYEYELTVDYSINELKIDAVPSSKEAKVEIEKKNLVVGENDVKITITNEKNKNEYILKVTREENVDKSVANLSNLTIDEYSKLDFDENVLDYILTFSSVPEKLNIHTKAKDPNAKIYVSDNEKLSDGSKIVISVKVNDITREYTLLLKENHSISDNKSVILVAIIGLIITIIVLIFLEIRSKKIEKKKYLKKIFDLRHKIERKRKEEKEKSNKEEKDKKLKLRIKPKEKPKKVNDDDIEVI